MLERQNGSTILKHVLTIQTDPIVTDVASNILFVTGITLWFSCPRNNHFVAKPFQSGTWVFTKGKETSVFWHPAKLLQNVLRSKQTRKLPYVQQKSPVLYPNNNFAFPICLALPQTLLCIHLIQALATGLEQIHFVDCGWNLWPNIISVELITGLDFCTEQLHAQQNTSRLSSQALPCSSRVHPQGHPLVTLTCTIKTYPKPTAIRMQWNLANRCSGAEGPWTVNALATTTVHLELFPILGWIASLSPPSCQSCGSEKLLWDHNWNPQFLMLPPTAIFFH